MTRKKGRSNSGFSVRRLTSKKKGEATALMGLSTHILDTALGRPAVGVALVLSRWAAGSWEEIGHGVTDGDGRCRTLLGDREFAEAEYRLRFEVAAYFAAQGLVSLYPYVEIVFTVRDAGQHLHIPLLVTANGYTTYRGS